MSIIVISFLLGILLIIFGLIIWKKEKIELIHAYHHKNVADKKGYAQAMGKTIALMGLLIIFSALLALMPFLPQWLPTIVLYVGIAASIVALLLIQYRYNGSVFKK